MKPTREEVERWRDWWRDGTEPRAYAPDAASVCDAYLTLLNENERLKGAQGCGHGNINRAVALADAACDSVWGGECGWEDCTDEQFKALKSKLYQRKRQAEIVEEAQKVVEWEKQQPVGAVEIARLEEALAKPEGGSDD